MEYFDALVFLAVVAVLVILCICLNKYIFAGMTTAVIVYVVAVANAILSRFAVGFLDYAGADYFMHEPGFVLIPFTMLFLMFGSVGVIVTAVQAVAGELKERGR
jgi:hypothetical protein